MKKHTRRLIIAMLLGVVVYGAFALYSGYHDIAARLADFTWSAFGLACLLAFTNYLLRFVKWEYYLARLGVRGVRKLDSLLIFLSGFVLTVTPGKVGEVFKSLLLYETHKVPVARTAPIVVAERLTDLIGIIVLIVIGSLGFSGGLLWAALGTVAVVGCLLVIMSQRAMQLALRLLARMPGPVRRLEAKVRESWESLRTMTTPGALWFPALLSVVAWTIEGTALWVILRGFGAAVPVAPSLFFYATSQLAGALTPLPGGLGVTEGLLEGQLRLVGDMPQAVATASMMLTRFATLWFAVAVGFAALGLLRLLHPQLRSGQAEAAESTTSPSVG